MTERKAELMLLVVGILWGLGYIGVDQLLAGGMKPYTVIGTRFLIAVIFLGAIFWRKLNFKKSELANIFIIGLTLFLAFAFQTVAMNYTTTTNVSFITGINIVFVPFIAAVILKNKIKKNNILAAVIGFAGLGILTGGISSFVSGDVLTLVSAFLFALHIVLIGKFAQDMDVINLAIGQMAVCSILAFIIAFSIGEPVVQSTININPVLLLFVGIVPSALCFLGQNVGLKYTDEAKGSLILATESLWGAVFAIILLGEAFTWNIAIGAMVMLLAIVIDEIKGE